MIKNKLKNLNYVFLFWFIAAILDFTFTSIGVFLFGNDESNPIPLYVMENFGFVGFMISGILYLYLSVFLYNIIKYENIKHLIFLMFGGYHLFGAWSQLVGIIYVLSEIFIPITIYRYLFYLIFIVFYGGTILFSYYTGTKNKCLLIDD